MYTSSIYGSTEIAGLHINGFDVETVSDPNPVVAKSAARVSRAKYTICK